MNHQNPKSTLKEHFACQLSSREELIKFRIIDAGNKRSPDRTDFPQCIFTAGTGLSENLENGPRNKIIQFFNIFTR